MKIIRYTFALLLILAGINTLFAQPVPIGQWRDELPYALCNCVADAGSKVYISTPYAVFYYDKEDNSITRITKITGLSDIGISAISYNQAYQTLVITYTNANIDLIKNNTVINISDIKRKTILGNKKINSIYFIGQYAYLSCGFGIVVLDISKEEIHDTFYIGKEGSQVNVLSLTKDDHDTFFAAAEKGIYKASASDPNLANYNSWHQDLTIDTAATYNTITFFAGKVFVNKRLSGGSDTLCYLSGGNWNRWMRGAYSPVSHLESNDKYLLVTYDSQVTVSTPEDLTSFTNLPGAVYPRYAITDKDGWYWIATTYSGTNCYNPEKQIVTPFNLPGPSSYMAFSMASKGNDLYIAPGGYNQTFSPNWTAGSDQVYHFDNTNWTNIASYRNPVMAGAHDIDAIAIDPNDPKHIFAATFGSGVYEIYNDSAIKKYDESNSALAHHTVSSVDDIRVAGLAFDADGNLWAACSHNNKCLSMKKGDTWTGYTVPIVNEDELGPLLVDKYGQVWVQMRYKTQNTNSILVFSNNGTPDNTADDKSILLNANAGSGNIPGTTVYAMAEDKKGEIWIGTEKGIAVFYSPENVFTGSNFDCQQILVTQGSYVQYLLENETVTAIAVDGANRKWIGTDRGGVYLFSEDGTSQIYHFTAENSPLLSDRISCLAINQDGEVFFGTDMGVISFRATATTGAETNENVYAFPNPVKADYDGFIAVKGLVENAQVRITDVNGNLVCSTRAEGGQAVWNGKNLHGVKVRTGVYLVYATNDAGSEKVVTKILFIN